MKGMTKLQTTELHCSSLDTLPSPTSTLTLCPFHKACGNHQEEVAEGFLVRFPQLRQFPQRGAARPRDVFGGVVTAAGAPCRASSRMPIVAYRGSWRRFFPSLKNVFRPGDET